jgi:UDP-N-acetylglucosamine diphosphorylase/glucosamine-1-phosphate N-acetyltransferase
MKFPNIILFDGVERNQLLPLTFTRPIADTRCGIFTLKEKWQGESQRKAYVLTQDYLQPNQELLFGEENLYINAAFLPNKSFIDELSLTILNSVLYEGDNIVAIRSDKLFFTLKQLHVFADKCQDKVQIKSKHERISRMWDLFIYNGAEISKDIERMGLEANGEELSNNYNTLINPENIYVESGVKVQAAILNASEGPIYIGDDVEIMEGSILRGPIALCSHAQVKMGAKIYGNTTIGPHCKAGGEIQSSVMFGYSNKGHDGYLGNSVIGEWCNLGADTNTSNLKNNYSEVKVYDYQTQKMIATGQQFCGLFMGDHAKSGINTMFNTGTSVGVAANVFGGGFPDKKIPSFAWGGREGWETFTFDKACEAASKMMERRKIEFDEVQKSIFKHIFDETQGDRNF